MTQIRRQRPYQRVAENSADNGALAIGRPVQGLEQITAPLAAIFQKNGLQYAAVKGLKRVLLVQNLEMRAFFGTTMTEADVRGDKRFHTLLESLDGATDLTDDLQVRPRLLTLHHKVSMLKVTFDDPSSKGCNRVLATARDTCFDELAFGSDHEPERIDSMLDRKPFAYRLPLFTFPVGNERLLNGIVAEANHQLLANPCELTLGAISLFQSVVLSAG